MTTPNEQAGTDACLCYCHKLSHFAGQCTECRQYGLHQPIKEASPSSVTDAWERFHANTTPHSELAPQTTPSKAVSREQIQRLIVENRNSLNDPTTNDPYDMTGIVDDVLDLITTTLTQAILPHEPGDLDKQVDAWLRKNNVGVNQFAEFVGIFAWMNAEVSNRAIAHALTQHNEALLAKLPEKHKFTDKPRNTIHAMANEAEVNGFNDCLDQVTAIIKGSTHD